MTDYIVLRRGSAAGDPGGWEIIGHAEAGHPHRARKAVSEQDGEYLVCPVRNATFISASTQQPPPKSVSVEVSADNWLPPDNQETMVLPPAAEQAGPEPDDPEPVAA